MNQTPNTKQPCCDKCYSIYTEKTWPSHTEHDACINSGCSCHQPPKVEEKCCENGNFDDGHVCLKFQPSISDWEKELDKKDLWDIVGGSQGFGNMKPVKEWLKSFIGETLAQQRKEIVDMVEGMKVEVDWPTVIMEVKVGKTTLGELEQIMEKNIDVGYNQALDDVLSSLKGVSEKK